MRQKLDYFLNRWTSRKLMVFAIATALCLWGHVSSADWVTLAIVYIGTQGAVDIAMKLKSI